MAAKKRRASKKAPRNSGYAKDICFVIMPFGGWLDDYYQDIYCPAIVAAGLEPHRADDLFRPSTIVTDIWSYTKRARLILADLSGKNPNVFYELGLGHALAKPAILVAESMDDVPFDLRALRVLVYDKNAPDWGQLLKSKVQSAIKEVLATPAEAVLPAFLETRGGTPKPTVTPHEKELLDIRQQLELLREEMANSNRGKRGQPPEIGPEEARSFIERYLSEGMADHAIARRLQALGAPRSWTLKTISDLRPRTREARRVTLKT
jgi:hypothetical protein